MHLREVREVMVAGAARLLAVRGLEGTSFAEVLAATGAPRGSTYHPFPGGKRELVSDAVEHAGMGRAVELKQKLAHGKTVEGPGNQAAGIRARQGARPEAEEAPGPGP